LEVLEIMLNIFAAAGGIFTLAGFMLVWLYVEELLIGKHGK
jgi:hypothetical protein